MPGKPIDTGDGNDQAVPFRTNFILCIVYFNGAMLPPPMADRIVCLGPTDRRLGCTQGLHGGLKFRLISFYLGDKVVISVRSSLKCFFDSASRQL